MLFHQMANLRQQMQPTRKAKKRWFQTMMMTRAHLPLLFKVKAPHPSNQKKSAANISKAPNLPRSLEDKLNSYDEIIHDSDEEGVFGFTGPHAGRFLPLWHHVHEKSYGRKKRISELIRSGRDQAKEIREKAKKITELNQRIDTLMGRSRRHTEIVCNLISCERVWGLTNY